MSGRTAGGATVAVLQGCIVVVICLIAGFRPHLSAVPIGFLYMCLIAILFTALGTSLACLMADFQGFQLVMNFLVMPIFFLSGALFPLLNLPKLLALLASVDPLSYGIDGLRGALTGVSYFGAVTDIAVLSVVTGVLLVIGTYLFSRIEL
jgi:ABC-2 type transport system permease protein